MNLPTFIGTIGATIILIAFTLNEIHKLERDDLAYDFLNLVGAALLLYYALYLSSIPFAILNAVWFLVALRDVILDIKRKR